jgi:hypothetical protein
MLTVWFARMLREERYESSNVELIDTNRIIERQLVAR